MSRFFGPTGVVKMGDGVPDAVITSVGESGGIDPMERLRYERGEEMAVLELDKPEDQRIEIVALGCIVPGKTDLVWTRLHNESKHPHDAFDISDEQMRAVVADMLFDYGDTVTAHVLWHSHYVNVEPSKTDVEFFPEWLVGVGIVYHAPTRRSYAYDRSGVITGE